MGLGKIARDQHLPAISRSAEFRLAAVADPASAHEQTPSYPTLHDMLQAEPDLDAVVICTPPQMRHALAREALAASRHVLLEKPPGATLSEVDSLIRKAAAGRVTLFASWHSRFAPRVAQARDFLLGCTIKSVRLEWREDVRRWHPGQDWIWTAGGLGVFDPGINAISIVTAILPAPIYLTSAALDFPSNRETPVAAELIFHDENGVVISASFDFLHAGEQKWEISCATDKGELALLNGGADLRLDGHKLPPPSPTEPVGEYPALYAHFAELIRTAASDADAGPLQHVADAFLRGRRRIVAPFEHHPQDQAGTSHE